MIVTHNMQQAARVSDMTAVLHRRGRRGRATHRTGRIVEYDDDREDLHEPGRPSAPRSTSPGGSAEPWPRPTRAQFHDSCASSSRRRSAASTSSATALDRAIEAVAAPDIELAAMVIDDDDRIDGRYLDVHQGILIAAGAPGAGRQRPAARRRAAALIMHVERMGDQCVNIAKLVPLTGTSRRPTTELLAELERDGRAGRATGASRRSSPSRGRDLDLAEDLVRQDDEIDAPQPPDLPRAPSRSATTRTPASGRCT